MDGLSTASAAFSITVQLAQTVKKLCEFWASVKDTPQQTIELVADLHVFADLLDEIARDNEHVNCQALESCLLKVKKISSITRDCEAVFTESHSRSIRTWAAIKAALKQDRIIKFQKILEETKPTLILSQQSALRKQLQLRHTAQAQELALIAQAQQRDFQLLQEQFAGVSITTNLPRGADAVSSAIHHESSLQEAYRRIDEGTEGIQSPAWIYAAQKAISRAFDEVLEAEPSTHHEARAQSATRECVPIPRREDLCAGSLPRHRRYLRCRAYKTVTSSVGLIYRIYS